MAETLAWLHWPAITLQVVSASHSELLLLHAVATPGSLVEGLAVASVVVIAQSRSSVGIRRVVILLQIFAHHQHADQVVIGELPGSVPKPALLPLGVPEVLLQALSGRQQSGLFLFELLNVFVQRRPPGRPSASGEQHGSIYRERTAAALAPVPEAEAEAARVAATAGAAGP